MAVILLLSGPSLNLLGEREPELYGTATLDDLVGDARSVAEAHGHTLEHLQTAREDGLVDAVRRGSTKYAGMVINAAHFTHTSASLAEAVAAFEGPTVEVHITNPYAREEWRRVSMLSPVVTGTVAGFGRKGYRLALEALCELLG